VLLLFDFKLFNLLQDPDVVKIQTLVIMSKKKLVVIGGDAAGMSAASKVRREQPGREIVVFEKGRHTSYAACGIPYFVGGLVERHEMLIAREPAVFREKQNIDVRILHEVVRIDAGKKRVQVDDLSGGRQFWEYYDELLIATGASPVVPDISSIDAAGIFALSSLQSGIDLFKFIAENKPGKAVIAGGGYIGIEMAEALADRGFEVSLIDMASQVMTTMDEEMTRPVAEYMVKQGVKVFLGEKIEGFEKDSEGRVRRVLAGSLNLESGLVILGLGVKPNSALAREAGIPAGAGGAIKVDKRQETGAGGVWAAGDCAESYHILKKRQVFVPLGTVANKQGLVAGICISGGDAEFPGVLGTAITRFRDMEMSRTGLSEKEAGELGLSYRKTTIESPSRSSYFPGSGRMTVKLLAEEKTGRIIGGQIVGMNGSAKRIDTVAAAITAGMTAQQVVDMDLAYAPPFSPVWDPVQTAARTLL